MGELLKRLPVDTENNSPIEDDRADEERWEKLARSFPDGDTDPRALEKVFF